MKVKKKNNGGKSIKQGNCNEKSTRAKENYKKEKSPTCYSQVKNKPWNKGDIFLGLHSWVLEAEESKSTGLSEQF